MVGTDTDFVLIGGAPGGRMAIGNKEIKTFFLTQFFLVVGFLVVVGVCWVSGLFAR